MKKPLLITVVLTLSLGRLIAAPVDINTAQSIGEKFIKANLLSLRNFNNTEHVFTMSDDNGNPCLYIFNIDDKGYFIMSADDRSKPILAYSDEGSVDMNNIPSAMMYYLNHYKDAISYVIENDLEATDDIRQEWDLVTSKGIVTEKGLGRSVGPLVNLLWNQDYPYNYYCPTAPGGPGGRAYVGCAADAMAMIMKYWNYPDAGVGEHSYIPPGFPQQSITLGEEYDWNNMPIQITSSSPQNQIHAIALLMYHCGVTINMGYGADGSGAYSEDVPEAMSSHFKYTEEMRHDYRDNYTKTQWEDMLISNFDQGFPVYYAGQSNASGGHAFICDGYNDNRYIHFNWGWSGWNNGYFAIDAVNPQGYNFSDSQRAIFDFIPDYAYNNMVPEIDFDLEVENIYSHKGIIEIEVPDESVTGEDLTKVEKIIVLRNNEVVHTIDNPTPGETIYVEDEVPEHRCYTYTIYGINEGVKGRFSTSKLQYGPVCEWKLVCTTTSFQGWNGGRLLFLNEYDEVFDEVTMTSSSPMSEMIDMPEGTVKMKWTAPSSVVNSLTIKLRNSSNEIVYDFSGSSTGLQQGVLYSDLNNCEGCLPPHNFAGEYTVVNNQFGALLTWEYDGDPKSFKVYRSNDNYDYEEIATVDSDVHQYFDAASNGSYYYKVTAYNNYCESTPAWTSGDEADYVVVNITSVVENNLNTVLFPNPTTGILNIKVESITNVAIYNIMGQKIIETDVDADEFIMNMDSFDNGVYMIKIQTKNGEIVERITVID